MVAQSPPGYTQGGSFSAKLDRLYLNTAPSWADMNAVNVTARQGWYSSHVPPFIVSSGMNVVIGPCMGICQNTFTAASGDYKVVNDANITLTPAASSPTLNRKDILGFQVRDNFLDSSGLNSLVPTILQGANSAGVAADPTIPASFIPVVRAVVGAGVTSPTLESMARRTTSDGGVLPVDSLAERAIIVSAWPGARIYRTDKLWDETYDGSAWRTENGAMVTALADITNPRVGQVAVLSTDNVAYRWSGSVWEAAFYTGRKPMGEWRRNANFSVVGGADRKMSDWDTVITTPYEITHSAGNFTFARSGVYSLVTSNRRAANSEFYMWWGKASDSNINRGKQSGPNGGALSQVIATTARITAGDVWCVWYWSSATVNLVRETATAEDYTPYAHIRYLDPL